MYLISNVRHYTCNLSSEHDIANQVCQQLNINIVFRSEFALAVTAVFIIGCNTGGR